MPPHPGLVLRELSDPLSYSAGDLSQRLGLDEDDLLSVLEGGAPVSPPMALALERMFGPVANAEFWLYLQADYDLAHARRGAMTSPPQSLGGIPP